MSNNKTKILLYNPSAVFYDMPLALIAIGSQLDREKYEIIIIDHRTDLNAHELLLNQLEDCLLVGMTVLTGAPIKDALELSNKIKQKSPNMPIVWGGWHSSMFAKEILAETNAVDFAVKAQGEETFKELVSAIHSGSDLAKINGIVYRKDQEIKTNPSRPTKDMNELVSSDYSLISVEKYFSKKQRKQFDYISSTGCFFRCTFCADPFVFNRKFVSIDAKRVVDELTKWHQLYSFEDVNFQDETFFTYKERVLEIAEGLYKNNVKVSWAATMRADQCRRMSEEEFSFLANHGMRRILVGVESGSQEMMDWLKKDIKIEDVYLAAERCVRYKVAAIFPFIIGFPDESEESVHQSLKMAAELRRMSPEFQTPIFYYKPYPGAQITTDAEAKGFELPSSLLDWGNFDYIGSSGPWVNTKKEALVENFKFYNKLSNRQMPFFLSPLKYAARSRSKNLNFKFPIEKKIISIFKTEQQLS